ncbi:MAG: PAS domain S-box protein, partial [Proteobacteria bacterium]|nr:PAS domain S-box protein [Pseudomonadota bacterium]
MPELAKVIATSEDWLMERVLSYALARGYTKYTSTLKEAWRLSISGLSGALLSALPGALEGMELGPDDTYAGDAASAFAVQEARLHRTRGISLAMFLGLLKYYRQSYLDLLEQAEMADGRAEARRFVERFFDRVEVGIASEWCSLSEQAKLDGLQEANRLMVNEKNRYLTLFESLSTPVVFISQAGLIENINLAALTWLGQESTPGAEYFHASAADLADGDGREIFSGRAATEVFPWLAQPLERMLKYGGGQVSLTHRLGKGRSGRDVIATVTTNQDISGQYQGVVLVIQEVTELVRSRELVAESNRRLEAEVRMRTKALEQANLRLKDEVRERELYQQALTESASLYRAVVEDQGELICRFQPQGVILFANKAYTRVFGGGLVSQAEIPARIQHQGVERSLDDVLALITEQSPVLGFEQQASTPSGQKLWYSWTCRGIYGSEGALVAYQLVGQDVTRAREAEQALRELNESLERTVQERTDKLEERAQSFERMNENLTRQVESRKQAELALAKAAAEQQVKVRQITALYGLSEVLRTHWNSAQEMLSHAADALQQGWRKQGGVAGEIVFDGQPCRSQNYQDGREGLTRPLTTFGQVRGSVAIFHVGPDAPKGGMLFQKDEKELLTTIAHQIERSLEAYLSHTRLAQSEHEFREFFDNAAEAIFIHDENGQILDANINAGIWLNLATEDMVGASLLDFAIDEDREGMAGRFLNALREAPEMFQLTLRRKDGFAIPLELLCQAQDYQGRRVLVSSGRNITKRQQAEAEAQRRMDQERLLSGISSRLVNAIGSEIPAAMHETLAEVCGFVGMQRAAVYRFEESRQRFDLAHQWSAEGLQGLPKILKTLGRVKTPWLFERTLTKEWLTIRAADHLPPAAYKEKRLLGEAGVNCLTVVPMSLRGRLQGLFLVASQKSALLPAPDPRLLLQFATMFSNVMLRQHIRKALNENANLTTSILNALSTYLCVLDKRGEITLVNRTLRLAPFIVVFVDSKIIGALAKAVDLYRSVKPGQTR